VACAASRCGDSLLTTSLEQGDPSGTSDVNRVVEQHTITGGRVISLALLGVELP